MSIDLEKMYNELNDNYSALEEKLFWYKSRPVAKYLIGTKLFVADVYNKKEVIELNPTEIIINKFGISYRDFINEKDIIQFPEYLCFDKKEDAELFLKDFESKENK